MIKIYDRALTDKVLTVKWLQQLYLISFRPFFVNFTTSMLMDNVLHILCCKVSLLSFAYNSAFTEGIHFAAASKMVQ